MVGEKINKNIENIPHDNTKHNKKNKFFIVIGIALLIIVLAVPSYFLIENYKEQKGNEAFLKLMKCWAECPYEFNYRNESTPVYECLHACSEKYLAGYEDYNINKFDEETRKSFFDCYELYKQEKDFKDCLNLAVEEKKDIIDLSGFNPEIEFQYVELKIINLTCDGKTSEVRIKLEKGEINGVIFIINGDNGDTESIKDYENERIFEGEEKSFLVYSKGYIDNNISSVEVSYVDEEGQVFEIKDERKC